MNRKSLLILLLLQVPFLGYSQFKWLNPLPQGNTLFSVCFPDTVTGYAAGGAGTILMTGDAGKSWSVLNTHTKRNLNSVFFINPGYGFAAGDSGTIIRTSDHGASWTVLPSGVGANLFSVFFTDSLHGFSCGRNGILIRTINGGNQWDTLTSSVTTDLYSIEFPDKTTGYIAGGGGGAGGRGYILKSTDGGNSWNLLPDYFEQSFYSIDFPDSLTGYAAGNFGYVTKTNDGGHTWTLLSEPYNTSIDHIRSMKFFSPQVGFLCDVRGSIYKTTDGGINWIVLNSTATSALFSIAEINDTSVCSVGIGGITLLSNEFGNSFCDSQKGLLNSLYAISRTDHDHIFVAGDQTLIKTNDGGVTWETQVVPELKYLSSVDFINSYTGFALTGEGVYKTTNSGHTWFQMNRLDYGGNYYSDIFMINELVGFIVGGSISPGGIGYGFLSKTTDGTNWVIQNSPAGYPFHKIYFTVGGKGFLLGNELLSSSDMGNTWDPISLGASLNLLDIKFTDDHTGFLLGYNWSSYGNTLFKTTDGGIHWEKIYEDAEMYWVHGLSAVSFLDNSTGYAVGTNGYIIKTNDGGKTWVTQDLFTSNMLYSVMPVTDSSGYIAGENGTFVSFGNLTTTGTGNLPYSEPYVTTYPNPFSTMVLFEMYSNIDDVVSIEFFDLNGRLADHGIRHIYQGKQTISFTPSSNLKNGIYLYKIRGKEINNKGKLILKRD